MGVWHRAVIDLLLERLVAWKPALYTGTESVTQKRDSTRRFCDPTAPDQTPVLLMSNRSGAGLDGLQYSGCSVIVHVELDWAPAVHEQTDGRVYRDGQPKPVVAYYLVTNSGSDPLIEDTLGLKADQLEGIRSPHAARVTTAPDQTEIRTRMKRLAIDHLRKHDPGGLAKVRAEAEARLMAAIAAEAADNDVAELAAALDALAA